MGDEISTASTSSNRVARIAAWWPVPQPRSTARRPSSGNTLSMKERTNPALSEARRSQVSANASKDWADGLLCDAGVGHVRTDTAVGGPLGFRAWEAVEKAATLPGVEVRQVAMPIDSNLDAPEVAAWVREAAARGAVAVGGAPWRAE